MPPDVKVHVLNTKQVHYLKNTATFGNAHRSKTLNLTLLSNDESFEMSGTGRFTT